MRISTRGRYGTRALLALAAGRSHGLLNASQIASHEDISLKYLEHLLGTLKAAGLVTSERGKQGGYALARPPESISLLDILAALGEGLDIVHCTRNALACPRSHHCITRGVWQEIRELVVGILQRITLDDILQRQLAKESQGQSLKEVSSSFEL